jgi:hypothetical protein
MEAPVGEVQPARLSRREAQALVCLAVATLALPLSGSAGSMFVGGWTLLALGGSGLLGVGVTAIGLLTGAFTILAVLFTALVMLGAIHLTGVALPYFSPVDAPTWLFLVADLLRMVAVAALVIGFVVIAPLLSGAPGRSGKTRAALIRRRAVMPTAVAAGTIGVVSWAAIVWAYYVDLPYSSGGDPALDRREGVELAILLASVAVVGLLPLAGAAAPGRAWHRARRIIGLVGASLAVLCAIRLALWTASLAVFGHAHFLSSVAFGVAAVVTTAFAVAELAAAALLYRAGPGPDPGR